MPRPGSEEATHCSDPMRHSEAATHCSERMRRSEAVTRCSDPMPRRPPRGLPHSHSPASVPSKLPARRKAKDHPQGLFREMPRSSKAPGKGGRALFDFFAWFILSSSLYRRSLSAKICRINRLSPTVMNRQKKESTLPLPLKKWIRAASFHRLHQADPLPHRSAPAQTSDHGFPPRPLP